MSDLIRVAERAGVSRATAARAFSDPHLLKPGTLKKVLDASEALGFRPNHIARQLRTQSSTTLGVLLPSLSNPVFALQLQAMEHQARLAGYGLLVATTDYQPEREAAIVEHMLRQRVAGMVLTVSDADSSAVLPTLAEARMPFVLAHNMPQNTAWRSVCVDNRRAMAEATAHLIALGHRHIVMAAGPMLQSDRARQRYLGYCDAMQQAGFTPSALVDMPSHIHALFDPFLPLMTGSDPLTAVICSNDLLAISLMGRPRVQALTYRNSCLLWASMVLPSVNSFRLHWPAWCSPASGWVPVPSICFSIRLLRLRAYWTTTCVQARASQQFFILQHQENIMSTHNKIALFASAALLTACALSSPLAQAEENAICYNCPPEWADWATQLQAIKKTPVLSCRRIIKIPARPWRSSSPKKITPSPMWCITVSVLGFRRHRRAW